MKPEKSLRNQKLSTKAAMDIANLYSHLTSEAQHYQELQRTQWADKAVSRWPLLGEVHDSIHSPREAGRNEK